MRFQKRGRTCIHSSARLLPQCGKEESYWKNIFHSDGHQDQPKKNLQKKQLKSYQKNNA